VVGDPAVPMTAKRGEVFKPLGLELAQRLEARTGTIPEAQAAPPPPSPPGARDIVESRLIPCDHCGTPVALLIFAPEATDPGQFEDCARKMYAEFSRLNVATWIIGPANKPGNVARNANRLGEVAKGILGDDLIPRLAQNDSDGWLVVRMTEQVINGGQVEVHLPGILRLEGGHLKIDHNVCPELEVVEEKVDVEILPADFEMYLLPDEGETGS